MRIEAAGSARVIQAIAGAAARTGSDFGLLLAQARVESGLRPDAAARGSSARGLFQFTSGTWLEMVRRHGAEHGLGWAADALAEGGAAARAMVLKLREDPESASLMAGALAHDNRAHLERRLGRPVSAAEVHMAHFLGAGGATRFLRALAASPAMAAARVVPAAAAANRAIFQTADGQPRSLAEVMDLMAGKLGLDGGNRLPATGKTLPAPVLAPLMPPAQLARLLMAQLGAETAMQTGTSA